MFCQVPVKYLGVTGCTSVWSFDGYEQFSHNNDTKASLTESCLLFKFPERGSVESTHPNHEDMINKQPYRQAYICWLLCIKGNCIYAHRIMYIMNAITMYKKRCNTMCS